MDVGLGRLDLCVKDWRRRRVSPQLPALALSFTTGPPEAHGELHPLENAPQCGEV
jgi:hypothetical protein